MKNDIDSQKNITFIESNVIKAIKAGDLEAFETILTSYEKQIYSYIYRMVNNKENAQDLLQDTFIKVYKKRAAIDEDQNFKAWLYKIATNTVYDWFRKKKNIKELLIIDDPRHSFETIDDPDTYYNIERALDIEAVLNQLKPAYKTVLLLHYYRDFTYEQIASILALPMNTVKTHIARAKQELKIVIENELSR